MTSLVNCFYRPAADPCWIQFPGGDIRTFRDRESMLSHLDYLVNRLAALPIGENAPPGQH